MDKLSEEQWVKRAHTAQYRPPMPGFALHAMKAMKAQDLRALYPFIRYLGPAGEPAPADLPPDPTPNGPPVLFPGPPP